MAPVARGISFLRHAAAIPADPLDTDERADFLRSLSPAGARAARECGATLREEVLSPDYVLCSPALRTRQTLEHLNLLPHTTVEFEPALYFGDTDAIMLRLEAISDKAKQALIVGHNPTIHIITATLAGDRAYDPRFSDAFRHYPPCTLSYFEVDGVWTALSPAHARLAAVFQHK